ncbi:MAG: peptidoglycan editing factor PgeF [Sphingomonadales bacterium]
MTLPLLTAPTLHALPGIRHGFFTRQGGVSTGLYASLNLGAGSADAAGHVTENRARVAARLGACHVQTLYQVHSPDAVSIDQPLAMAARPQADALITTQPGLAVGVLTADCVPVLLADADAGVIAAAHAGWRGTLAGIIARTLDVMTAAGANPHRIHAAIGPAIAQTSYEVGEDVRARFMADGDAADESFFRPAAAPRKWLCDLPGMVANRLRDRGIGKVETLIHDTYGEESLFYSFRRATHRGEPDYGRQISAIMLAADTAGDKTGAHG